MSRTLAIGDVHGCLSLFERLLDRVNYDPSSDHLVLVGDLVDRGPRPAAVVRMVRTYAEMGKCTVVQGNHDQKVVDFMRRRKETLAGGRPNGMRAPSPDRLQEWEELSPEDIAWMEGLPLYAEVAPGWIAVHAGFEDIPLDEQRRDKVCRIIAINEQTGRMASTDEDGGLLPGTTTWMDRWRGPSNVVYGHKVHNVETPRVDRPAPGVETWGIDTGACYGGSLTALILETREIFQVRDGKAYAELRRPKKVKPV